MSNLKLDPWQQQVLETKGNIVLRSGRQVGKSTIIGRKTAEFALNNPNKLIMVISKTERQAGLLFTKILFNIVQIAKKEIKKGKDRPTKHIINLNNGSTIHCLPAGDTGYGIMGFTIDLLIADEAAFIPEEVWNSIIPALAITRGEIWLLSTPFVKEGYYYECFNDPSFTSFHMSAEDCPRKDQEFLDHKKASLTKANYAQMYLGEFRTEIKQFFRDDLIKEICVLKRRVNIRREGEYYLGVDVARMGEDESTFEIIDMISDTNLHQVENITTEKTLLPDTVNQIVYLNNLYDFRREYIDSGGLGIGVVDQLRLFDEHKRKVVEINNAKRFIDYEYSDKARQGKLMKEVLYNNLLRLMERREIQLLDDDEIKASLKEVQFEYKEGKMVFGGDKTHIAEGLIRAVWCVKDKHLKPFIL